MERVAILIESTGERLGCLLNPDSLVTRRIAGVRPRRSLGGELSGAGLADDPLLLTGGGSTMLEVDLLFDVNLAGSTVVSRDVRDLTRPLWDLAENHTSGDRYGRPPRVRFVWGKSWNVPGIVSAVAERAELFTAEGAPQRSWLRLRLLRVSELPERQTQAETVPLSDEEEFMQGLLAEADALEDLEAAEVPEESVETYEVLGGEEGEAAGLIERLDEIAFRFYGQPWLWRLLAAFNGIDDPLSLRPGTILRIPPLSALLEAL